MKDKLLKNKKGFTLIELIVVIAIIGVLVLLATPKFINYLAEAKEARYAYNVKVVEQQMEIYQVRGEAIPNIENWSPIEKETLEQMLREGKVYSVDGNLLKVNLDDKLGAFIFTTPVYADELVSKLPDDIYKIIPRDSELLKDVNDKETYIIGEITNKVYYINTKLEGLESEVEEPEVKANDPEDFSYTSISGGIEITDYKGISKNVVIPKIIEEQPVVKIRSWAFSDKELETIIIPEGIKTIDHNAFSNNNLVTIEIPDSVKEIGQSSFINNKITNVVIGNGVEIIEENAFRNNKISSLVIGDSVKQIARYAFYNNLITSLVIPDSVITIESNAFEENEIAYLSLGNKVETIGWDSFSHNKLTELIIPDSVIHIHPEAFSWNQLTSVKIGNGVDGIWGSAFVGNQLKSIVIPENVKFVQEYAFQYNPLLTEVVIENKDLDIGNAPFHNTNINASSMIIYGYDPSTAKAHADSKGYTFKNIDEY